MHASKLSRKGQVTIPKEIRRAIGAKAGDLIAYHVDRRGVVRMRRAEPFEATYHKALSKTLTEWTTREDDEAFRDL